MLENEQYTGSVKLLDSVNKENYYLLKNNHEPIISEEAFKKIQEKKKKRSNIITNEQGTIRKDKKYSSKRGKLQEEEYGR